VVSWGQNLVPNPSFEQMNNCPTLFGDFSVSDWTKPTQGSPDYFNTCNGGDAGVPNNILGNQNALSGNAYVGLGVYDTQSVYSYREYVQVHLQQSLNAGQKYWVSFYVSLSDSARYAIQEMGIYFSSSQINQGSMDTTLMMTPQIEFSDGVITDKNTWTKVNGSFMASGNENFIVIGNFNRKQTTNAIYTNTGNQPTTSYYYIDDVCVADDSLTCASPLGTQEENAEINFTVYPNPVSDFLFVSNEGQEPYDITIYNALGQLLYSENGITTTKKQIDCQNYGSGLILISIKSNDKILNYKFLKPKL